MHTAAQRLLYALHFHPSEWVAYPPTHPLTESECMQPTQHNRLAGLHNIKYLQALLRRTLCFVRKRARERSDHFNARRVCNGYCIPRDFSLDIQQILKWTCGNVFPNAEHQEKRQSDAGFWWKIIFEYYKSSSTSEKNDGIVPDVIKFSTWWNASPSSYLIGRFAGSKQMEQR